MKTEKLSENCGVNRLPPELLTKIAAKLDWPDQIALLSTSKGFAEAAKHDSLVAVRDGVAADIAAAPATARRPDDVLKLWRVAAPKLRTAPFEPMRAAVGLAHDMRVVLRNPSRLTARPIPDLQTVADELQTQIGATLPQVNRLLQRMTRTRTAQRRWSLMCRPCSQICMGTVLSCLALMVRNWSHGIEPALSPYLKAVSGGAALLMLYADGIPQMVWPERQPSGPHARIEKVAFLRVAQAGEARQLQVQKSRLALNPQDAQALAAHHAAAIRTGELSQEITQALASS